MTEPVSHSGPRLVDGGRPRTRLRERLHKAFSDPVEVCAVVVACIPLLTVGAMGSILWRPLGVVGLLYGAYLFPRFHREVRSAVRVMGEPREQFRGERRARVLLIFVLAAAMSIPLAQAFFANDLRAMAAPTISAVEADTEGMATAIPPAIYGSAPTAPSYGVCESIQYFTAPSVAWPCYSAVGYLRLWQMSSAVVMMSCLFLLVVGLPLTLLWHVRSKSRPKDGRPHLLSP